MAQFIEAVERYGVAERMLGEWSATADERLMPNVRRDEIGKEIGAATESLLKLFRAALAAAPSKQREVENG
jgi:hypothetical protein